MKRVWVSVTDGRRPACERKASPVQARDGAVWLVGSAAMLPRQQRRGLELRGQPDRV